MKKAFTIVELAIVLVIIGIILGMAVKGRNLVEAARYKAEINKIRKLEAAVHIWLVLHPEFINNPAGGMWGDINMQDFFDQGILNEGEIRSLAIEGAGAPAGAATLNEPGYWKLMRCQYHGDGLASAGSIASDKGLFPGRMDLVKPTNICAQIIVGRDKVQGNSRFWYVNMPKRLQCMTELLMDDQNLKSGHARYDARFTNSVEFTEAQYKDCMALSMNEAQDSNLFYALY